MNLFGKLLVVAIFNGCFIAAPAMAGPADFHEGPVFKDYGKIADVDADFTIPKRSKFSVLFDTSKGAPDGGVNGTLDTAARFINMHVAAGVKPKDLKVAVVVHGKASFDLVRGDDNATAPLISALKDEGVRIILCGQSAAYHGIAKEDLLPGVEMALSAMTAHAVLQNQGYTLNPF